MRTIDTAPRVEQDLSYQDFAADPVARAIGLDVLGIMDNQELDAYVRLRTADEMANVIRLPAQVGRMVCAEARVSVPSVG